jgi:hypothetical protein
VVGMFSGAASIAARKLAGAWRVLVPVLFLGAVLPAHLIDPGLVGNLLHRLPHPGDGFDLPSGRQLYESAQLAAAPFGAAAFVQVGALAVTLVGILMLALLA